MPTLVAIVTGKIEQIVEALMPTGLAWSNPSNNEITVWRGDRLVIATSDAAIRHWHQGGLLQLWRADGEDLAIGQSDNGALLYFDGLTASRVALYLSALGQHQIAYVVVPEDEA